MNMLKTSQYGNTKSSFIQGLSKFWNVQKSHSGVYTGGHVELAANGEFLGCLLNDDVALLDASTGELKMSIQQDLEDEAKESIVSFAIRPDCKHIVTASRNLLIRLWNIENRECIKVIKAHQTPVLSMSFDPTGTLVATGGSDRVVKVFDIEKGYCTHNFRGHEGIVSLVKFHPNEKNLQLISCSMDSSVRIWDLYGQKCIAKLTDHMSQVTDVTFSSDGWTMLTSGRDKVINIWDLHHIKLIKTLPIYESIEGIQIIPNSIISSIQDIKNGTESMIYFMTAGENGILQLWSYQPVKNTPGTCRSIWKQPNETNSLHFTHLLMNEKRQEIIAITSEHNFMIFNSSFERSRQIIGYNDDIIDIQLIPTILKEENEGEITTRTIYNQIVVATNSEQIRLMNTNDFSCELLNGHTDIVMSVAVSPDGLWLVSVSKDMKAKIWNLTTRKCIATCVGHTEACGAVAISQKLGNYQNGNAFFVTGSADKTMKLWSLKSLKDAYTGSDVSLFDTLQPLSIASTKAHEKDVNAIAISPNDQLIASASQDKTIKIWNSNNMNCIGICRGHKRGVWAVQFSPVDQCLASSSGDKTIKIWSAKDFSCLKTFEGHTASVLNVQFLSAGMQLLSSGTDGLIKLWTIKTNECENTFDQHSDKIWALTVAKDSSIMISGGADSTIHFWNDITIEKEEEEIAEREKSILKEQELYNCMQQNDYYQAAMIAFDLGHPRRLMEVFNLILDGPKDQDPLKNQINKSFDNLLLKLNDEQLCQLLKWTVDWNTNAKTSIVAQTILTSLLKNISPSRLNGLEGMGKILESLIAYTERHFQRLDRLMQKSYLVDYSLITMKKYLPINELEDTKQMNEPDQERNPIEKKVSQDKKMESGHDMPQEQHEHIQECEVEHEQVKTDSECDVSKKENKSEVESEQKIEHEHEQLKSESKSTSSNGKEKKSKRKSSLKEESKKKKKRTKTKA